MAEDRRKYKGTLTRLQWRNIWADVQNTKADYRSQEDWLRAANKELFPIADAKVGLGKLSFNEMKNPDELVTLKLTYEAACGCKIALIKSAEKAAFLRRGAIREAAYGFGPEFGKIVEKAIVLEDSKDLEEDKELAGVPCEEEPAPAQETKKE